MKPTYLAAALIQSGRDNAAKTMLRQCISDILWTGTDLLSFVAYTDDLRGWGKSFQKTCQAWYGTKSGLSLAKALTKYRNREDWRHRDVLLKASVRPVNAEQQLVYQYIVACDLGKEEKIRAALDLVFDSTSPAALYLQAIEQMWAYSAEGELAKALDVVRDHGLPREVLPTELLCRPETWDALLPHMGGVALLRNLGNMSKVGFLTQGSSAARTISNRIAEPEWVRNQKLHPVTIFATWWQYKQGKGDKGSGRWDVVNAVTSSLQPAFYAAFKNVQPIGKRILISLDVSGSVYSLDYAKVIGMPFLCTAEAEALMAMVRLKVEKPGDVIVSGFDTSYYDIPLNSNMDFDSVLRTMKGTNWRGGTDAAIGVKQALASRWPIDYFEVHTDNESWAGDEHVKAALDRYRDTVNPDARLSVFAYSSTRNTLAKPNTPYMMDFVGFDTSAPEVASGFVRGEI
jgi:60 kDa SS-A/Ro ribonucleoprotein